MSEIERDVLAGVDFVEKEMGKKFGDSADPLLVSVRSGSRASMPGMMYTILNLGLNDEAVEGLTKKSGNERFAWDTSCRRFANLSAVPVRIAWRRLPADGGGSESGHQGRFLVSLLVVFRHLCRNAGCHCRGY